MISGSTPINSGCGNSNTTTSITTTATTAPSQPVQNSFVRELDNVAYDVAAITNQEIPLTNAQLYRHLRQEELLAFHHLVRALTMTQLDSSSRTRAQQRLLEDVQELLKIPPQRFELETMAASADLFVRTIATRGIHQARECFADGALEMQEAVKAYNEGSETEDVGDEDLPESTVAALPVVPGLSAFPGSARQKRARPHTPITATGRTAPASGGSARGTPRPPSRAPIEYNSLLHTIHEQIVQCREDALCGKITLEEFKVKMKLAQGELQRVEGELTSIL